MTAENWLQALNILDELESDDADRLRDKLGSLR